MGFDNECILNIHSLPGEYFCPVCRTLVYPNEALQAACTHLYCKPCLAYIVATTSACPYDGYLVSETDAKPLIESGKPIAEAIEKIQVHCLYHRSGCQWQGTLSECITHCTSCTFGNSPVVCNRCGTQIVHRQVQEHAQTCPGVQPQGSSVQNQIEAQSEPPASQKSYSQPGASTVTAGSGFTSVASTATIAAPVVDSSETTVVTTAPVQGQHTVTSQQQAASQAPTQEQLYQQYQQYYQQYPGFDPYQQQYQQYGYHQQQAQQQSLQTFGLSHPVQGQQQSQAYIQQYPQALPQPQVLQQYPQVQGQQQAQAHVQHQSQLQPQAYPQVQIHSQSAGAPLGQQVQAHTSSVRPQMQVSGQPVGQHGQIPQLYAHSMPHAQPPHMQHQPRPLQQQTVAPSLPAQPQLQLPHTQYQSHPSFHGQALAPHPNPQLHMKSQAYPRPHSVSQSPIQPQLQSQVASQPLRPPHSWSQHLPEGQNQPPPLSQTQLQSTPAHTVTGHQSFPQMHLQPQMPAIGVSQNPMQMQPSQHGPLHPQPQQQQFLMPTQSLMRPQHSSPLPQVHNQVQRPINLQTSQLPVSSNHQPQISSYNNQVQHQGSLPPQPLIQTQSNLHHQGQHPQPPLQPISQKKSQSTPGNHTVSHQQSQTSPRGVTVDSHSLPLESDSLETPLPTSPLSLKPRKEEANSSAAKAGLPEFESVSQKTDIMLDGLNIQSVESNTDEKKEDKMEEQSEQVSGADGNSAASSDVQHKSSLEHKDGDDDNKFGYDEETGSKTDGVDRSLSHGPGQAVNSEKVFMDDGTRKSPPSQALPTQVQSSGDPRNILPPSLVQPDSEAGGPSTHHLLQHQERHVQLASQGPSYMKDAPSQRPSAIERMLPKQMPYIIPQQEKMYQETSPRVLSHAQPLNSNQLRPSLSLTGRNPSPGFQGSHVPFALGPPPFVPPASQLQSHVPTLPNDASVLPMSSQVGPFSGPPSGPFGPSISMNSGVPPLHTVGQPPHLRQPGPYDGPRGDHIHSMASDSFALGNLAGERPKTIAANGFLGHADSSLPHALGGERFMPDENRKLIAAEGLGPPADPHFSSYRDPVRRVVDRRKLEEDLKQFPRPSELDSQGGTKFGTSSLSPFGRSSYADSAPRSFERGFMGFRLEGPSGIRVNSPVSSRSMPIYMAGSHIPGSSDGSLSRQMEGIDRHRMFHPGNSEFHTSGSEFGSQHMDTRHLSRSPGSESAFPASRFGSLSHGFGGPGHNESFGVDASGMLPNHLRMGNGMMPGVRGGESTGRDVMPRSMRSGDPFGAAPGNYLNHLPGGKLDGLHNAPPDMYSRNITHFGDYPPHDFSSHHTSLSSDSFESGYGSLDISRKRKESSTGWCLICDIYCETDEGRNSHYQTMEHQNRTMDIVLSIKQRYSKKLTMSSEEHGGSNKLQKADVEDHPNRR